MKRLVLALALLWVLPANAQNMLLLGSGRAQTKFAAAGGAFSGPGDVAGSAYIWIGLRAFSVADKGNKLINVCNALDAACVDMSSDASTGDLTITTVGGTDCSVLTCTIKIFYDRSGTNACSGPCDFSQATIASRATLITSCIGSKPCARFAGAATYLNSGMTTLSLDATSSVVISRTGVLTTNKVIWGTTGGGGNCQQQVGAANNTGNLYCGGANNPTFTMSDSTFHSLTVYYAIDTVSSTATVDGSTQGPFNLGNNAIQSPIEIGNLAASPSFLQGDISELGWWATSLSSTISSNLSSNQHSYWGF